ncbi:TolB family protein [Paenibacillus sp. GCM10027626]|uniref:TolB family protein n=1 Tax=Paenibacillus sp. GCM10027626 TaxID=3273411 RepID=UPI0036434AB5
MPAFRYELKKMLLKQKGLLFIVLYFVCSLASLMIGDQPANPDAVTNGAHYQYYLQQVKGRFTAETDEFFKAEASRISQAKVELRKLYDDYYDREITEAELTAKAEPLEALLEHQYGFQTIYDQYTYVRENPENRYFLATNGWAGLLAGDKLDVLFVLLLLVLIAPVFCFEYESRMDTLLLTVKKGIRTHARCKILLALITVVVLCLLSAIVQLSFFSLKYGLEDGSYPLQSLSYFGLSTKTLTLQQAFFWMTAGRIFGCLVFAMMIIATAVYVKRYALTLFICTAVILLPHYSFALESTKYWLPGPLGFMLASGFLRGNEFEYNLFTDQMDAVYKEVTGGAVLLLLTVTLLLGIALYIGVMRRQMNMWSLHRRRGKAAAAGMLLTVMTTAVLSGCTSSAPAESKLIYNEAARFTYDNDQYRFRVDTADPDRVQIVYENKATGEQEQLIRQPLRALMQVQPLIAGRGPFVYYLKYDNEKSGFREMTDRFSVVEVDTRTFDERIIFERNVSGDRGEFLGIYGGSGAAESSFFVTLRSFFVGEREIYFVGEHEIRKIELRTGKSKTIITASLLGNIGYDGRTIYYLNDRSEVVAYDTGLDRESIVSDVITPFFLLAETELLYLNRQDQYKIYALDLHSGSSRRITERGAQTFSYDGQTIRYESKQERKHYRIDLDGRHETVEEAP